MYVVVCHPLLGQHLAAFQQASGGHLDMLNARHKNSHLRRLVVSSVHRRICAFKLFILEGLHVNFPVVLLIPSDLVLYPSSRRRVCNKSSLEPSVMVTKQKYPSGQVIPYLVPTA